MKLRYVLIATTLLIPLLSCDPEPELGDAIADVKSAAPKVCKDFCAWAQGCVWNSFDHETAGGELEAAKQDWQQACVITCANRSAKGTFVYESEWNEETEQHTYTFTEKVGGKAWTAYFKCLWQNEFWDCSEWGTPDLLYDNEAACTAYDTCVQILDLAIQYNWHPDAGENGECRPDGFDHLWDGWSYIW